MRGLTRVSLHVGGGRRRRKRRRRRKKGRRERKKDIFAIIIFSKILPICSKSTFTLPTFIFQVNKFSSKLSISKIKQVDTTHIN
jgi:hypothetical protein